MLRRLSLLSAIVAVVAVLTGCVTSRPADAIRVGSYNIRLSPGDRGTPNAWEERKADLVDLVKRLNLDAFGMQEVCPDQAQYLRETLPEFEFVGDHREADRTSGEASPVFYRKSRFDAEKRGTFWLSETPEVPASKSWNTACTRVCSYLVLRDKVTGRRFCFANTHTDHISAEAREKGMLLIIERMKEFGKGAPIVFTGDHNCCYDDPPAAAVRKVLKDARDLTERKDPGPRNTFHGFGRYVDGPVGCGDVKRNYIDYIYVSDGTRVLDVETHGDKRPGTDLYPSDHFPVTATIVLPANDSAFVAAPDLVLKETAAHQGVGSCRESQKVGSPCLQAPAETTMGVSWRVSALARGEVEIAENPAFKGARVARAGGYGLIPIDDSVLQVRLEGLKPATRYWYRTITTPFTEYKNIYDAKLGEPIVSQAHSFTTLGAKAPAHFCVINDTHAQWKAFEMVVAKAKALSPTAIVWNGDATNTTQDKGTAVEVFLDPPIATKDWSSDIPVLFESGNHDFRGSWISKKEEVVFARHPAERRGDQWDLKWNFAVRLGDLALIGMDTGEDKPDGHPKWFGLANFSPYRRAQAKWLEEVLARPDIASAKFKILFCHIPIFAAENHPDYTHDGVKIDPSDFAYWSRECHDLWAPLLEKAGVQLVVSAHRHGYRYDAPTPSRTWAQIVGGGPELGEVRGQPDESRFPTVIEGEVKEGRLIVRVHNVFADKIVGVYEF